MKEIYIYGDIVDKESDKMSPEDICPQDIINELKDVEEDITVRINSCGGSVSSGLSIASYLQSLKQKTTCIIDGVAASIASVIACACDDLVMHPSSYLMIHRVWGMVQGNCEDLRKEADTMEMMTKSLIRIYQRKFDLTEEEIEKLLADETWISGDQVKDYKINAIVDDDQVIKYAAKLTNKFNKCPISMNKEEKEEIKEVKETVEEKKEETETETETETVEDPVVEEVKEEVTEEKTEEETTEETQTVEEKTEEKTEDPEKTEEKSVEDLEKENEDLKKEIENLKTEIENLKTADVDKRVSGMQSKMQNKINDLNKDFTNKLEMTNKELDSYKNECISLKSQIEESKKSIGELLSKVSALTDELTQKQNALDKLNSGVLSNPEKVEKINWKDLKGQEFFDYIRKHPEVIK